MPRLGSFQAVESGWRGKGKKDHECWDGFLSWHHTACSSSNRGAQKPGQNFTNASNIDSGVRPSWGRAGCGHAQRDPIEQMSLTMDQETLGQGTGHKQMIHPRALALCLARGCSVSLQTQQPLVHRNGWQDRNTAVFVGQAAAKGQHHQIGN